MKRKILCLVIALVITVSFVMPTSILGAETVTITIAHTNDTHGRVFEGKYDGMGLAKIATLVDELRADNPNTLLFDAGDTFHGQTIATLVEGESVVTIMNIMEYDLMTPGNHDFNYGYERLLELADMADFPIISANVTDDDGTILDAYTIFEVDGIKLGVFGLSTPETTYKTHPDNVAGLTFEDPSVVAQAMVTELEGMDCDIIIALAHLGTDADSIYTSEQVVMDVDGIDLIVDGHSHSAYDAGYMVGDTMIVSAGEYDKYLGVVDLTFTDGALDGIAARLISKDDAADVVPSEEIEALTTTIAAEQAVILSVETGRTTITLDGERADARTRETNLGNLITDAMLAETGADVAVTNGGGIRASIDAGYITKGEIITVLPFGNYIVTKEATGADIKSILEFGTSSYPDASGKFTQVAGVKFTIDLGRTIGDRITNIMIGGEAIDFEATYVLATNDFMAAGGDGYEMIAELSLINEYAALDEALAEYIIADEVIAPTLDGRITVVGTLVDEVVEAGTYTVVAGDTLSAIASMYLTTWQELFALNSATIENADMISIGQEIMLP